MQTSAARGVLESKLGPTARKVKHVIEHKLPIPEESIKDVVRPCRPVSTVLKSPAQAAYPASAVYIKRNS